jgi:predicted permease
MVMIQDLRYAIRGLRRTPMFAGIVIASLALGIGANTALFSLMDRLLWRTLPVRAPEELVMLTNPAPNRGRVYGPEVFSYPLYRDLRDGNQVFAGLIARYPTAVSLSVGDQPSQANAEVVSGNYFDVLGVGMTLGRGFLAEEDRMPLTHPVAVLNYGYWMRRFGGARNIVGRKLMINAHPFTVVGVAARGFQSVEVGKSPDVYLPVMMKSWITPDWDGMKDRRTMWLQVFGRLKRGVTAKQAEESLSVLTRPIWQMELAEMGPMPKNFTDRFLAKKLLVKDGQRGVSQLREQFQSPLVVLLAMVGLLLLIACVNVAGLLLARAMGRQKEVAVRLAIGASRKQILRQLLTESLLLAVLGGAAGLLVAAWTGPVLLGFLPDAEMVRSLDMDFDVRLFAFTTGLSLVTGILFGIAPALQAAKPDLAPVLKDQGRNASEGGGHVRLRKAMVAAQVGLSLVLLVGAGLFSRSLKNLKSLDPGFRTENLTIFSIDPSFAGYDLPRAKQLFERISGDLKRLPGVQQVSLGGNVPLSGNEWQATVHIEGFHPAEGQNMNPKVDVVGAGYLSTLGIPIVAGREISEDDVAAGRKVAVVNQKFVQEYFPDSNPLGRHFGFGNRPMDVEIIGVAANSLYGSLRGQPDRFIYVSTASELMSPGVSFFVRSRTLPQGWKETVRKAVERVDARIPVANLKTMDVQISESIYVERMLAALAAFFGMVATLLAAVGLYGVMAFRVLQRTREIGIRMALGARRADVLKLVLGEVAWLGAVGVGMGLPAALVLSRFVKTQLFGTAPQDPATFGVAPMVLLGILLLAGLIPARRAVNVEPVRALHYE